MPQGKPNILVLWGDDIGWYNISHNNRGAMGYRTPNIDRIAREGLEFTDYYAQQSCTAGRAAFITGQNPVRTGLTKVGIPGAEVGLAPEDPTIAELLRPLGYATGHFGKNHLGDRDEFLPSNHGFDEFYGNLYHLNAEDEPEHPDYPKDPEFRRRFGPRGVIHSFADGRIEDTGPLTKKRMETIDDDVTDRAEQFIRQAHVDGRPFFVWWNSTRMHVWTRLKPESVGLSGQGFYNDAMVEHDGHVGRLLELLDELDIGQDTIVLYSTDNGPHYNTWPDGAISPWRSEKNTNWEGAFRVPSFARWPGHFPAGRVLNGIVSHQEWLPTLLTAAGVPDIVARLEQGHRAGDRTFRVHIDGYDMLSYLTGETDESPRRWFFYTNDDGLVTGIRLDDWKLVFHEQRATRLALWAEPFVPLRLPKIFNLRRDPFERADENSNSYWDWVVEHVFILYAAQALAAEQLQTFRDFPPRQKPAAFNLDRVLEAVTEAAGAGLH
ncbi:MAG: arylsulfatase [Acidimicrobiia bacterium]|nr:arylsulfatase [Acidimicrobiia bacterium]